MIGLVITLIVVGLLLWIVGQLPIDGTIKRIIHVTVLICVVIWLLQVFGVLTYDVPIPRLR